MAKINVKSTKSSKEKEATQNANKNASNKSGASSTSNVFQRNITNEVKGIKSILNNNNKTLEEIKKNLVELNKKSLNSDKGFGHEDKQKKDDLHGAAEDAEESGKFKPVVDAIQSFHKDVLSVLGVKKETQEKKEEKKGGGLFSFLGGIGKKIFGMLDSLFTVGGLIKAALLGLCLFFYKDIKEWILNMLDHLKAMKERLLSIYDGVEHWFGKLFSSEEQKKKDAEYNEKSEVSQEAIEGEKNFTDVDVGNTQYDIDKLKEELANETDREKKKELRDKIDQKYIDLDTQENQIDRRKRFKTQETLGMKSDIYHTQDGKVVDMGAKVGFFRGVSTWLRRNFTSENNLTDEEKEQIYNQAIAEGKSHKEAKQAVKEADEAKTKEWNAQRILGSELAHSTLTYGNETEQKKLKADIDYAREYAQDAGLNTAKYSPFMSLNYESDAKKEKQLNKQYNQTQEFATETANTEIDLLKQIAYSLSGRTNSMNMSPAPVQMSNASSVAGGEMTRF